MALQNYRERKISHHVILKANEHQIAELFVGLKGAFLEFSIGSKKYHPTGASFYRIDENTYLVKGYEASETIDGIRLPKDLVEITEIILEKELYISMSFRHEETDVTTLIEK